ncbi:MAG TPA: TatD family hydrolase [Polyangiaceae bacterium]|nr:TatD family hydrolase [Polyangiaceae bacterium]
MFDSHCHLTDLPDPAGALREAVAAGVGSVLTCGYDARANAAVRALRRAHPRLPWALGLHPWHAAEAIEPVLALLQQERPTAVGEIGLDLGPEPPPPPLARQIEVLEAQLDAADRLRLPVTLHHRRALGELLPVLRRFPRVRGALHACSGSPEQVRPFLDLGYLAGIGGAVTRPGAARVRRLARALPLDAILLETDAPAIGLEGIRPPAVRPAHLPRVLAALAELREDSRDRVEEATDANAAALFGPGALAAPLGDR